jgi:hypothetical protein
MAVHAAFGFTITSNFALRGLQQKGQRPLRVGLKQPYLKVAPCAQAASHRKVPLAPLNNEAAFSMASVVVAWNGRCPDAASRHRLLGHLHHLATLSDNYLRNHSLEGSRPANGMTARAERQPLRANIECVDQAMSGAILVSGEVVRDWESFAADAREAGLPVFDHPDVDGAQMTRLETARLRGLNFKLFDPRALYPGADRLSFVFLESDDAAFLDGCIVEVHDTQACQAHAAQLVRQAGFYLGHPTIHLRTYLEDWIDCLFSWVKFFCVEDLWWHRGGPMRGYDDYHTIFESLAAERGTEAAMTASYDAVLATFQGHAEHWSHEVVF